MEYVCSTLSVYTGWYVIMLLVMHLVEMVDTGQEGAIQCCSTIALQLDKLMKRRKSSCKTWKP